MVVGISGRYCAGKSEVSRLLIEGGFERLDVDALGHEALEIERERIIETFGPQITKDGRIDRRQLVRRGFGDPDSRRGLEGIVHPRMREQVAEAAKSKGASGGKLVIDAALLFYMDLHRHCDLVIWVHSPLILRAWRAVRRDNLGLRQVISRFRAQRHITPQPYLQDVDIRRVNNWGSRRRLLRQLEELPGLFT